MPDETPEYDLPLEMHWNRADFQSLLNWDSLAAKIPRRMSAWFVKACRCWGEEDITLGMKHRFHLKQPLVRSWRSIRCLIKPVAIAYRRINLSGDETFERFRHAILRLRRRLLKATTSLWD